MTTTKFIKGKDLTTYNREYAFNHKVLNNATYEELQKRKDRYSKSLELVENEINKRDNFEEIKRKQDEEKKYEEEQLQKTKNDVLNAKMKNKQIVILQKKKDKIVEKVEKMYNDLKHILEEFNK